MLAGDPVRLEMIAAAAKAGRDAAADLVPDFVPAVVVSVDPTNTVAMVQPDGPPGDTGVAAHGAAMVAPVTVRPGDRVMVMYLGTRAAGYVVGRRGGDWDEWHMVGDADEPPFLNGWANSAGTRAPSQNGDAKVMFTMRSGRVELRGRCERSTGAAGIFNLPEPYWPDNDLILACQAGLGSQANVTIDMATGLVSAFAGNLIIFDGVSYLARIQQVPDE